MNRQAVIPFFRPRLKAKGLMLDAGSGDGSLAAELGVRGGVFLDLCEDQVRRCRERIGDGFFVQGDVEHLPFKAECFEQVICSNVLQYTGLRGAKEVLRVTKGGGKMLVAFLEDSAFTRLAIWWAVNIGLFPPLLLKARLVNLSLFLKMPFRVAESATIAFIPPLFQARRDLPRAGLVAFELIKRILVP